MSGTITFVGLGTGTDFASVVDQLVALERYRINNLELWKTEWEDKIESIQGLNSRLLSLELFSNDFNTSTEFLATTAASSDTDVLTATSTSTAIAGAHTVTVGSNIGHRLASQGWATEGTAIGGHDRAATDDSDEDFVFTYGTTTITVADSAFSTNTTLSDFKDDIQAQITADGKGTEVGVEIIDDGSATNPYRLVIYAKEGGSSNEIVVTKNPTGLTFSSSNINPATIDAAAGTWTDGQSRPTSHGTYTGNINKEYTFTVPDVNLNGANAEATVTWSESETGRSGSITIPANYVVGTEINVDGVNDPVEIDTWAGDFAAVSTSENYTGSVKKTYTFTVPDVTLDGANAEVTVTWTDSEGGSGTVTITANYTGTALEVEKGVYVAFETGMGYELVSGEQFTVEVEQGPKVSFSAGTLSDTDNFYIDVFSNIDDVEKEASWTGTSSPTSWGHYFGSTNKTFEFSVLNSGTIGTDELGISWSDSEGNSGAITIPSNYTPGNEETVSVTQGLELMFSSGDLVSGEKFSINIFSPDLQKGQDSGMAQVEQIVHSGFADTGTTVVTGSAKTFSYIYGGTRASIDVAADATLSDLVGLINNDTNNPGVTASILNDGLGLSTSYHMVLTGRDTGAAYTITDITDTFTGGTFSSDDFTTTQEAQNSMLKVDGYPSDTYQYIQRSTNSVSDVIDGVTLSLVDSGSATVSITEDLATIRTTIETFVSGVNFVLDYIKDQTEYDEDTGEAGTMIGNYSYQIVQHRINDILTDAVPGLTDGVDTYVHLAQIGISTNPDNGGKWEIDSTTLNNALSSDLEAVSKLFIKDDVAGTNGVLELLRLELDNLTDSEDGSMNVLIDNYEGIIDNIDSKVEREERRVALVEDRLTQQFVRLEVMLTILAGQETYLQSLIDQLPQIGGND